MLYSLYSYKLLYFHFGLACVNSLSSYMLYSLYSYKLLYFHFGLACVRACVTQFRLKLRHDEEFAVNYRKPRV